MGGKTNPLGWPTWAWRCLLAFTLAMAAYTVAGSASNFARAGGLLRDLGQMSPGAVGPIGTPDWVRVTAVTPGDAFDSAGVRQGDLVRLERWGDDPRRASWPHPVTVERDGRRFRTELVTPAMTELPDGVAAALVLQGAGALTTLALAALLLIRARHSRAATMLGVLLVAYALSFLRAPPWTPNIEIAQLMRVVLTPITACIGYFKLLFALEISGGAAGPRQARLVHAAALIFAALLWAVRITDLIPAGIPVPRSDAEGILVVLSNLLIFGIIAWNYRRNDGLARNRIKIVTVALGCYLLSKLLGTWAGVSDSWAMFGLPALEFAGLALLTYAVLGQKLFDLNFALNRTLVYGSVSFILLAAFGLAKWVIEHLIPESWHAGSEYYSLGIALGLFLVLHRVHNWVERTVERFLFSPWHRNEEALRRFVTAAGHFDRTEELCRAFAAEASRFAKGAGAALYLREADGSYALGCGNLEGALPGYAGDDLALAVMRAERRPLRTTEMQSALPGVLALPMLDHGKLAGFALLDRKGDGADYRPDEIEVLGWAAHQVGLDLQAMHASELEAEVAGLNARLTAVSEERDRLGALLAGSMAPRAERA